jgi:hypothetical protein
MSPEQDRTLALRCLAQRAVESLGVNGNEPDAVTIMAHSIAQAYLELEAVERVLETDSNELGELTYIVQGIRQRLTMAQHSAEFLATVLAEAKTEEEGRAAQ